MQPDRRSPMSTDAGLRDLNLGEFDTFDYSQRMVVEALSCFADRGPSRSPFEQGPLAVLIT